MKIKHWAGYGSVTARKVSYKDNVLVVEVKGNHERGLVREYKSDVFDWLVKRFDKMHNDYADIESIEIVEDTIANPKAYLGYDDVVTYTIRFYND